MNFRFNIPVTKVDEEKRLVYGILTEEIVDQAGEILDYEGSKKYFQEWSDGIAKATGGASLGNLRLMHQPIIAGKLIELIFDDVAKTISCVAKIVSDDVWKLVLEGCLTGFSMGGKYIKRWKDEANKAITRFIAKPVEVSVVDNPCVSTATFEYIKSDGSIELRKFHTAGDGTQEDTTMFTQEEIRARAEQLAKAASSENTDDFMDEALVQLEGEAAMKAAAGDAEATVEETPENVEEQPAEEPQTEKAAETDPVPAPTDEELRETAQKSLIQVWQAPDGTTHLKKSAAIDHILANPDAPPAEAESPVEKALRLAREGGEGGDEASLVALSGRLETVQKGLVAVQESLPDVAKSIYDVTRLASSISDFQYIVSCALGESRERGGDSVVAGKLWGALTQMGEALVEMAQEEVAEMMARLQGQWAVETLVVEVVELAAIVEMTKSNTALVEKVGARNNAVDQSRIQATHDSAVLLGASCDCGTEKTVSADTIPEDVLSETPLVKALTADRTRLEGEVTKAVEGIAELGATIVEMQAKIEKFGKSPQPLPPRTDHVVVQRMGRTETINQETIEKMSPDERADLAIRLSQLTPNQAMPG